jgi:hypothetical protein
MLCRALLLVAILSPGLALAQSTGPSFCDDPEGPWYGNSPTGKGWRPHPDSVAGNPFKYKHLFPDWQDPVDINGNPIAPEDYYIGACPPLRTVVLKAPNAPSNAEVIE